MAGIPPGALDAVIGVLQASPTPVRRRPLLAELESRGHRISLAGLNRILEECARRQLTSETPDGVRLRAPP